MGNETAPSFAQITFNPAVFLIDRINRGIFLYDAGTLSAIRKILASSTDPLEYSITQLVSGESVQQR